MGFYRVNYGDYSLGHCDDLIYFNYFEFKDIKYPVGSFVKLNNKGMYEMYYNKGYGYVKGDFRLVDHYINSCGKHEWVYFIGYLHDSTIPVIHKTMNKPDDLLEEVLNEEINEDVFNPGELEITFYELNISPKDYDIDDMVIGWTYFVLVILVSFVFKDWLIKILIQFISIFYFTYWRNKKINNAIKVQNFKYRKK